MPFFFFMRHSSSVWTSMGNISYRYVASTVMKNLSSPNCCYLLYNLLALPTDTFLPPEY